MTNRRFANEARFIVYLLGGAAVMASCYFLHPYLMAFTTRYDLNFKLLGKTIDIGRFINESMLLILPLIGALIIEFVLTGKRHSSLRQLSKPANKSLRVDLLFLALDIAPVALPLLINVMTFGVVTMANRWLRDHVPPDLHLFDLSVNHLGLVFTAIIFVLSKSFIDYWLHRMFHTPLFWPLHRIHHSASELTLATSVRGHPAGQFLAPLANTLPMLLWAAPETFLLLYFAFNLYHEFFVHSDADIDWGWIGRVIQGAPINHKLHHSMAEEHFDKNFSTNLPIWDRMFGTYVYASSIEQVGVPRKPGQKDHSIFVEMVLDMKEVGVQFKKLVFKSTTAKQMRSVGNLQVEE